MKPGSKNGKARLHIDFDNAIADAWSLFTLLREWADIYHDQNLELPPLAISFRDYVLSEQAVKKSKKYSEDEAYWNNRLETLPLAPALPLATDPANIVKPDFSRQSARLGVEEWRSLQHQGSSRNITPACILMAAYAEVLHKWSGSPSFTINTTLFNRLPLHEQVDSVVGDFTSLNLLEVGVGNISWSETFAVRADRLQRQLWQDLDHRLYGGVEVMRSLARKHDLGGRAVMPVVFTSALMGTVGQDASVLTSLGDMAFSIFQTPQVWLDHQVYEHHGELVLNWDSVEGLFPGGSKGMMKDMFTAYIDLLRALAKSGSAWEQQYLELPAEQNERIRSMNDTGYSFAAGAALSTPAFTLHGLFSESARRTPYNAAVISSGRTFSYEELEAESTTLAAELADAGVSAGDNVAVYLPKGWEQPLALLAVLKAGAAYLPMVWPFPEERLRTVLRDSGAAVLLTTSGIAGDIQVNNALEGVRVLCLDKIVQSKQGVEQRTGLSEQHSELLAKLPTGSPERLAYIIYTSGSTGIPKGVAVDHAGAVNTILDLNERFKVNGDDRILALSSLGFDLSVYDIFGAFSAGAALVLPDAQGGNDPYIWLRNIEEHNVTIWNSAPALMQMLLTHLSGTGKSFPSSLRLAFLSGDWIAREMARDLRELAPEMRLISMGGATEASIWSVLHEITNVDFEINSIPYGRPMRNQRMYVLDSNLSVCPEWVPGDLYIGGIGLAQGYWNDSCKTESSFIIHPESSERLYKTGDLARFRPEGFLEFIGRKDTQVKIRGHRVELGEIESAIISTGDIEQVLVQLFGRDDINKKLVAYVVAKHGSRFDGNILRQALGILLPRYMIPETFIELESFPLTANGKIDRKQLPVIEDKSLQSVVTNSDSDSTAEAGSSFIDADVMGMLMSSFALAMSVQDIDIDSNFFDMGISSFHLVQIQNEIRQQLDKEVPIVEFFVYPTIRELAAFLEGSAA